MMMYDENRLEYKYWGLWGPAPTRRHLLSGAIVFLLILPVLAVLTVLLVAVILAAIAFPPLGLALLTAGSN
jgi:hypothetical protein